ncbi:MAG: DinB family protein, partial [Balneolaceae bacterium]|nr:DinB family protein [Balneolaceae bacterium]
MKATKPYTYSDFIDIYRSAGSRIRAFDIIPEDLFTLKPDSKSWSAAEICSHITTFNRLYLKSIDRALNGQPAFTNSQDPSFRPGFLYGLYASSLEPPYKVKLKTLRPLYPADEKMNKNSVIEELIETEESILNQIDGFSKQNLDLSHT